MLTITPRTNAASSKKYYQHEDVAVKDREFFAEFGGKGIDADEFTFRAFNRLVDGKHPDTGSQLTPRQRSDRIVLWDATFDPPKSVTLAIWYNREGDALREAFHAAVRDTMREYVEPLAATRVRKNGVYEDRQTQNMTWAFFPHTLARPVKGKPDPNEHVHVTVFNHTWDAAEQRFKALKVHEIKKQAPVIQDEFHKKLRQNVEALGFKTVDKGKVFELEGVPQSAIKKFSQRRSVITDFIEKHLVTGKRKGAVGIATREAKEVSYSLHELKAEWDSRLTQKERMSLEWLKARPKLGNLSKLVKKNKAHVAVLQRLSTLAGFNHERETRGVVQGR